MIVVTTNELPGYRIQRVIGEVMGITVRSTHIGSSFTASLRAIGGGEIPEYTKIVTQSRNDAMSRMVTEAQNVGANAIVAMRFDTEAIGQFSEVCAYGTAAVVEPIPADEPGTPGQSAG